MTNIIKCSLCSRKTGKSYLVSHDRRIIRLCHNCRSIHFSKFSENNYTILPLTVEAMEALE